VFEASSLVPSDGVCEKSTEVNIWTRERERMREREEVIGGWRKLEEVIYIYIYIYIYI
jgi:hypothetical protein